MQLNPSLQKCGQYKVQTESIIRTNKYDISKQGRSSSIGAKTLPFVLRQLTDDFKEKNTK